MLLAIGTLINAGFLEVISIDRLLIEIVSLNHSGPLTSWTVLYRVVDLADFLEVAKMLVSGTRDRAAYLTHSLLVVCSLSLLFAMLLACLMRILILASGPLCACFFWHIECLHNDFVLVIVDDHTHITTIDGCVVSLNPTTRALIAHKALFKR